MNILLGNGDGTFKPKFSVATAIPPRDLGTGDFDADGCADVAAATYSSSGVPVVQYRPGTVADGTHQVYATFEDLAGNKTAGTPTLSVRVDTKPPVGKVKQIEVGKSLSISFSERIAASLAAADLVLENIDTGKTFAATGVALAENDSVATWTLDASALTSGRYRVVLAGSAVRDVAGNAMAQAVAER